MASCVIRRGLLSTLNKYSKTHTLSVTLFTADPNSRHEVNRCRLQCPTRGVFNVLQQRFMSSRPEGKVLETVGVFEAPKQHGKYETGQLFLHSVFGYRGIVLFPWHARLYDRDITPQASHSKPEPPGAHGSKEVKGKTHTYYQVLIDTRDCPHISQRSQTEAVTFLANHDDSRALYAIPGLDYVSHEDILPYNSTDQVPIQHELFERFLMFDPSKVPPFVPRDTLRAWQEKNHPWLELSDVHRETTENIRVTVIPFYMGMREAQNSHVYWWRYCIRLENLGNEVVQLRERHWRIFSLSGTLETVRGRGVVGRTGASVVQRTASFPVQQSRLPTSPQWSHVGDIHLPEGQWQHVRRGYPLLLPGQPRAQGQPLLLPLLKQHINPTLVTGTPLAPVHPRHPPYPLRPAPLLRPCGPSHPTCLTRRLHVSPGGRSALRGRMGHTLTCVFHLSPWRATKMTSLLLLGTTGRANCSGYKWY
ncbi:polymerase delta-interacting protein 2-like isoform X2 [Electrophorus electricus]|uniref:polymerase delta-interacting protein 2-like isoform X2 n=1 Tax=Electrophorus electricus TaxID=8005 RepID=UPI0015CFA791|nr:polymerase delta-interacting protein 2-like isoform X2 [Electrophorus electricus]